jgi:glucose/arabinose dehydrogenase
MRERTVGLSVLLCLLALVLAGCGGSDDAAITTQPPAPPSTGTPALTRTTIASAGNPWDLAFAPDGTMFFTERCAGLSVRTTDGTVRRLFGTGAAAVAAPDLFCEGQSGMHGVAVDPDFASNRYVYVYMLSNLSAPDTNRVVRLTVNADYTSVSARVDIITDISYKAAANSHGGAGAHSGGRIRFGTDGLLYVTTGDNHNGPLPQSLTQLGGKVLRVDRNGAAASGNSTPSGGDTRIFTLGHRNVQGIAFRPGSGQPFICEHGPGHTDEVTPLVAGGNGGWSPAPQAGVTCASNYCGYGSNRPDGALTRMTDLEVFPNAMRPSWTNGGSSQGMGPCTFLSGSQWQSWDGRLLVSIMGGQRVELLQLDAIGMATGNQPVGSLGGARVRSLVLGPENVLYATTDAGEIWRIVAN